MQSGRYQGSGGGLPARPRRISSKPVGSFVPQLVREACRRRGFNNIDIVLRWRDIVGPALAEQTWPLRIEWPRRHETMLRADGTETPGGQRTRLVVGSVPARVLDVEYAKGEIVERVNRYLGYRAATELAATPDYAAALEQDGKAPAPRPPAAAVSAASGDDPLKAALARLGRAVATRGF